MKKCLLIVQVAMALGVMFAGATISQVQAAQVTLQWDANTPAPQGYRLYQRMQKTNYGAPVWTGTDTAATIRDLTAGIQYYFVARAFAGSVESGNSNEVAFMAVVPVPTATPSPTPAGTPEPTAPPEPKCFHIVGDNGFIETVMPGVYAIEDMGKLWVVNISAPAAPSEPLSGNTGSMIFHRSGCRYYQCATCTLRFKTREEAVAAGYKPCGACRP